MFTEKKLMTKVYKVSKVHKFGPILFGQLLPFLLLKLSLEVKSCQAKCKFKSPGSTALLQYVHQSFFDRSFGPIRRPPPLPLFKYGFRTFKGGAGEEGFKVN